MDTPSSSRRPKTRPLALLAVVALVVLLVVIDMRRRSAEQQLQQLSVRLDQVNGSPTQNREAAQRIVNQVRKLYALPEGVEPTVATIVDVNTLRERNPFYNRAKNGDYLIVTTDRAILFDAKRNIILDVVPVQIQAANAETSDTATQ